MWEPKTLVVSFVYEIIIDFLPDFFNALKNQTTKSFDVVIFDYGISQNLSYFGYNGKVVSNNNYGIIEARDWALNYAKESRYELLIFIDADDVMADNRVETTKKYFDSEIAFYYSDLYLLSNRNKDFFSGMLPQSIETLAGVMKSNFVGLSHFAINITKCRKFITSLRSPEKLIAYDWYLVSRLLIDGYIGVRIPTKTYYRIYKNNIAGFTDRVTSDNVIRTLEVKDIHYASLSSINCKYSSEINICWDNIKKIKDRVASDSGMKSYLDKLSIKSSPEDHFWWGKVK